MAWEYFPEWFRRRMRRSPYFRSWFFGDIEDMFKDMEEMMEREFKEFSTRVPKDLVRERKLPDGSTIREWGPFVYGYSVTIGPDGKPQVREFGNVKPKTRLGRPRISIKEQREPLVDIMQTPPHEQMFWKRKRNSNAKKLKRNYSVMLHLADNYINRREQISSIFQLSS